MGRQSAKNLHRDTYQKDISEGRRGNRKWRSYIGISPKRGEESKRESRHPSNRSLKTDGETVENLHWDRKRGRGRDEKGKSRDLSKRSLKTDGETESGEPTKV